MVFQMPRVPFCSFMSAFLPACRLKSALLAVVLCWSLSGLSPQLAAAPFRPLNAGQMRTDFQSNWAGISTVHGTSFSGFIDVPTTLPGHTMAAYGTGARIWNASGRNQPGVLLDNQGPDPLHLYPGRYIQGAGVTMESTVAGPVTFTIGIYLGDGTYVAEKSVSVADGRTPVFLGLVDPETRIGIISLFASNGNRFTLSNLVAQDKKVINTDVDTLPSAGEATFVVDPLDSYLFQGYGNPQADAPTTAAMEEQENVHDVLAAFPSIRPGDVVVLERLGSPVSGTNPVPNQLLGVFSSSQELLSGLEHRRVPGAIKAGIEVYTPPVAGRSGVVMGTNVQEDFIIGDRSPVIFPGNARYLFLSRATPSANTTPLSVRLSHIPRKVFEAWVSDNGLAGTLALPASDLDGDGLTLLEEYAFGKDPTVADSGQVADFSFRPELDTDSGSKGRLSFRFGARMDGPIRYHAEVSSDLRSWERLPSSAIQPLISRSDASRTVFGVADSSSGPKRFGRLVLDYIPPPN